MKIRKIVEFRVVLDKDEFELLKYIVKDKIDNYEYRAVNGEYMFNLDEDMYFNMKRVFKDFISEVDFKEWMDERVSAEDWLVYNKTKVLIDNIYLEERYGGYDYDDYE
jgi:hypothetical protein